MKCPKCDSENVQAGEKKFHCRDCAHDFPADAPAFDESAPEENFALFHRKYSIRRIADRMVLIASICGIADVMIFMFSIIAVTTGADAIAGFVLGAVCGGAMLLFYLIAQVAYIRAEKVK